MYLSLRNIIGILWESKNQNEACSKKFSDNGIACIKTTLYFEQLPLHLTFKLERLLKYWHMFIINVLSKNALMMFHKDGYTSYL